ncbi:MAG: ABC transporter permease, partial [Planctomycetota bacterium]
MTLLATHYSPTRYPLPRMYRTFVIARHTAVEAMAQPIYLLVLAIGAALMCLFGLLPFFTLGVDTKMFLDVGRDFVLLLVLLATL